MEFDGNIDINLPSVYNATFAVGAEGADLNSAKILWHPQAGAVTDKGYRQNAAQGLLHELAEVYYLIEDPEGHIEEYNKINRRQDSNENGQFSEEERIKMYAELDSYDEKMREICGEYHTYSDKWIIQNVEPGFDKAFNQKSRDNHKSENMLTTGPFSRLKALKGNDKYNSKRQKNEIKRLAEKVESHQSRGI